MVISALIFGQRSSDILFGHPFLQEIYYMIFSRVKR